jgi:hypothetical protein
MPRNTAAADLLLQELRQHPQHDMLLLSDMNEQVVNICTSENFLHSI